jgi:hypothetical protein
VKENDVLFCTSSGEPEEVVQVCKVVEDGLAYCHVGYLPKRLFQKYGPKQFDKMFFCVLKDYRISDNSHERSRSHHFYEMALGKIIQDDLWYLGKDPLNGDRCIMIQNEAQNNTPENECTTTELTASVYKPVEIITVYNRRKAITVLPPHPANEPLSQVLLTPKDAETKQQEDEIPITNFAYFSKIAELAEVSNCQQFGTPDSKRKHPRKGLSPSLSWLDSSLNEESSVDEDELPIDELVYTADKSSPRKVQERKSLILTKCNMKNRIVILM